MIPKVTIHLTVPHKGGPIRSIGLPKTKDFGKILEFRVACDASAQKTPARHTDDPVCVTCEACKATPEFERILKERTAAVDEDEAIVEAE